HDLAGLAVWFFDDAPTGGCRPPAEVVVQVWKDRAWKEVARSKEVRKGKNQFRFPQVKTGRIRLEFTNAGKDFYTGLYGFEPQFLRDQAPAIAPLADLVVEGDKYITPDDVLVTSLWLSNRTDKARRVTLRLSVPWADPKKDGLGKTKDGRPTYEAR